MLTVIDQQHVNMHKLTWTIVIKGTRHGGAIPAGGGGACTGTVGAVPWRAATPAGQNCQKPPQGIQQNLHNTKWTKSSHCIG